MCNVWIESEFNRVDLKKSVPCGSIACELPLFVDFLEVCGQDPETNVIGLYIEGIRRTQKFFSIAKEITPKKPILALVIGSTVAGSRAANSHT